MRSRRRPLASPRARMPDSWAIRSFARSRRAPTIDQPPNPPMVSEDTPDQNVYLEALPAPETVGSYLFGSTKRLDSFLGGGMVTVPLVGQAPVFDPRIVKALPAPTGAATIGKARGDGEQWQEARVVSSWAAG